MKKIAGFALEEVKRELFTAVVGDVMDGMGLKSQFLPPQIRALDPGMVVVGPAMPVQASDIDPADPPERPFGLMLRALDDLRVGEVYITSGSTGHYALWGQLMSERARYLGAAGAVVDGFSRDTALSLALDFPIFSHGSYAQDLAVRGHVTDFRVPIAIGEVVVGPGDIVFGDRDGVCIVPADKSAEIFESAFQKCRSENLVRDAIKNGVGAAEAFDKYGVM